MKRSVLALLLCAITVFTHAQPGQGIFSRVTADSVFSKDYRFRTLPGYSVYNALTTITAGDSHLAAPAGSTEERPTVPEGKYIIRYNTDSSALELGDPDQNWRTLGMSSVQTFDTSSISNFFLKVRSLISVDAPLEYNGVTGKITIAQAGPGQAGYLSQADWIAFNSKLGDPGSNGLVARTAEGTLAARQLVAASSNVSIVNPNGVSGNPSIDLNDTLTLSQIILSGVPADDEYADSALVLNRSTGMFEMRPIQTGGGSGTFNAAGGGITYLGDSLYLDDSYILDLFSAGDGMNKLDGVFNWGGEISNKIEVISSELEDSIVFKGTTSGATLAPFFQIYTTGGGTGFQAINDGGVAMGARTKTGAALYAFAQSTGTAIVATTGSGTAVQADAGTGTVFKGSNMQGHVLDIKQGGIDGFDWPNEVQNVAVISRGGPFMTPENGFGLNVEYRLKSSTTQDRPVGRHTFRWSDITDNTRTADYEIYVVDNAVLQRRFIMNGNGAMTWSGYTNTDFRVTDTGTFKPIVVNTSTGAVRVLNHHAGGSLTSSDVLSLFSAGSGLTKTSGEFKLGGNFSATTLTGSAEDDNITISSNVSTSQGSSVLKVENTNSYAGPPDNTIEATLAGDGTAIRGTQTGGSGLGIGIRGIGSGVGVWGRSSGSDPMYSAGIEGTSLNINVPPIRAEAVGNSGTGNQIMTALEIRRRPSSAISAGVGSRVAFTFPSYDDNGVANSNVYDRPASIDVTMLNLFGDNRTAQMDFYAMGDSVLRNVLTLHGDGNIVFPTYIGTNWDVANTDGYKMLIVDNSGNVRKTDLSAGGVDLEMVKQLISDSLSVPDTLAVGPSFEVAHMGPGKDSLYLKGDNNEVASNVFYGKNQDGIRGFYPLPVTSVAGKASGEILLDAGDITSGRFGLNRMPLTGVTAGVFTNPNIEVNENGLIVAISNGTGGGSGGTGGSGEHYPDSAVTNVMWASDSVYQSVFVDTYIPISDTFYIPADYFRRGDRLRINLFVMMPVANDDSVGSNLDNVVLNIGGTRTTIYNKPDDKTIKPFKMAVDLFRTGNKLNMFVDQGVSNSVVSGFPDGVVELSVSNFNEQKYLVVEYFQGEPNPDRRFQLLHYSVERARADENPNTVAVAPTPTLSVSPSSLSGFNTEAGTASASQSFSVSGDNLIANATVTAPADFEVSLDDASYASSQNLAQSGGNISGEPVTVYVRIKSDASEGTPSGNVTVTSSGATTKNVAVSGTVTGTPEETIVAQFNFGLSSATGGVPGWVDCIGLPGGTAAGHTAAVRSATDTRSGSPIGVNTISTSNWQPISTASNTCASDIWGPTSCTGSCYFGNITLTRGGYGVEGTTAFVEGQEHLEFTGLNPDKRYKFEIIGSRTTGNPSRRVVYFLVHNDGVTTDTLDVKDNTAKIAGPVETPSDDPATTNLSDLQPKPNGTIRLFMKRDSSDSNNIWGAYISAVRIIQLD